MSSTPTLWTRHVWLLSGPLLASCFVGNDRCGKTEKELSQGEFAACQCAPGLVPKADNTGCEPCAGQFEEAVNGTCQCMAGYTMVGSACTAVSDSGSAQPDASIDASGALTGTSGQGDSCQSNADCAGKDATWCMNLQPPFQCLVQDCANGQRACASDRVCCDLSGLVPTLSAANGLCVPQSSCAPFGGKVVTP